MKDIFSEEVQKSVYGYLQEHCPEDRKINEMKACFYTGGLLQLLFLWTKDPDSLPVDEINWLKLLVNET